VPEVDRRRFLQITGGSAALSVLAPSIARAASIPANRRTGSIKDVEHVVVLMQENRAFDHYFGTMKGVRGYGDPHPAVLRNGKSVFRQPAGKKLRDEVLPFRPPMEDLGLAFLQDIDHNWESQHGAFAEGNHDRWVPAKGTPVTMAHLERDDIPFHYALADAFTLCDGYHCSMLGPTNPNRYYMWSGWVGNDGKGNGPAISNNLPGYDWRTYPERLQHAGVTWKVYQDAGAGLTRANHWGLQLDAYTGNYGDNALLYFDTYQKAKAGNPLRDRSRNATQVADDTGTGLFDQLTADFKTGATPPQVSWIVAPEAFTEHPNWPSNYGAWYVSQVLDALTQDEDTWGKTALFLTYDENDGFFDHQVPPYPNVGGLNGESTVSLANEYYTGKDGSHGPYGLGIRVPMTVISPWSTGGWVCSETFDHTSIIRFLEKRFGVHEPNITPWRRTVCGDLTSAFDFSSGSDSTDHPVADLATYQPPDNKRHNSYVPDVPVKQRVPSQEPGVRSSRALGYLLDVDLTVSEHGLTFALDNRGTLGAHLQARSNDVAGAPFSYTIGAGRHLKPTLKAHGRYDVSFHGPAGFFRRYAGSTTAPMLEVRTSVRDGHLVLHLHNRSGEVQHAHVADAYGRDRTVKVRAKDAKTVRIPLTATHRWYDVLVTVRDQPHFARALAGRLENGRPGKTDPQLGR
jgi:phospholipase C